MNKRKIILVKLVTIYSILKSKRIESNLLIAFYNYIDFYVYNNKTNKELQLIKDTIMRVGKRVIDDGVIVDDNILLNMLDQILEDEKLYVKHFQKRYALTTLQNLILEDSDYQKVDLEKLEKAEEINNLINKILEE